MVASSFPEAGNWWYHYESRGSGQRIESLEPIHLALSEDKLTPDFANYQLDCSICHPQILSDVTPGRSTIVIKTSAGVPTKPFVVGYARVEKCEKGVLSFDRKNAVLLLDDALVLDARWSSKLIPDCRQDFWDDQTRLSYKVGTKTRNRKIESESLQLVLQEFDKRVNDGAKNYMGSSYSTLLKENGIQYTTSTSQWSNTEIPRAIVNALEAAKGTLTAKEISNLTGCPLCQVRPWLKTLYARGRIISPSRRGAEKLYEVQQ